MGNFIFTASLVLKLSADGRGYDDNDIKSIQSGFSLVESRMYCVLYIVHYM